MRIRTLMLATAASGLIGGAAPAAPKHHAHTAAAASTSDSASTANATKELMAEVQALKDQVQEMQDRLDLQSQFAAEGTAQQAGVAAKIDAAQLAISDQQKTVAKLEHPDKINFKGITITPGGYIEAAGIYRSRFQGDDIASNFAIPFPGQSHPSHTAEGRFSARQSRVSLLAQGKPNKATTLSGYVEVDFQGAAQTSNSNQSNSYVPRIRNVYGTIDWDRDGYGLHVLAGQNWSLLTMQGKGITARSEVTPPQIDAQYVPGFAWARQPGVRLVGDFMDHKLWLGVAAENPQTTFGGTAAPAGVVSAINGQGLSGATITCPAGTTAATLPSACSVTSTTQAVPPGAFQQFYNGVGSSLSLNQVPDVIGKVAFEDTIAGHAFHVEGFAIYRTFTDHINGTQSNNNAHALGYGGSIGVAVIPKILDVQFSGIGGEGIGRYGSAGLPDVTFDAAGRPKPIGEFMFLAGATLHATPKVDVYGFAGEEQEYRMILDATHGLGLPSANNSGCFTETATTTTTSTCGGNTRRIRQITAGVWDKFYQGPFGRAQVGFQWSYTQRQLFEGTGGMPQVHNNMGFVSFRYYPF